MVDGSNWWVEDEGFRGRKPAPRTENYINKMTFEELDTAFRGGTDAQSRDEFEGRDNVLHSASLYDSSSRLADVQDTYLNIADLLRTASDDLFGEWQGAAASASFTAVGGLHERVVGQFRSLSDAPLGENTASGQLYNMAVAVDWARNAEQIIRTHYQSQALNEGADTHTVDGGLDVIHISDTPEIKQMYAEDLAAVLDTLADEYVYRTGGVTVYGVSPNTTGPNNEELNPPPGPGLNSSDLLDPGGSRPDVPGIDGLGDGAPDGGADIPGLDGSANPSSLHDAGPGPLAGLGGGAGAGPTGVPPLSTGMPGGGGASVPSLLAERPDGALLDGSGNPVSGLTRGPNGSVLDSLGRPVDGLHYDSDGNLVDDFGNRVTPGRLNEILDEHARRNGSVTRPSVPGLGSGGLPGGSDGVNRPAIPGLGAGGPGGTDELTRPSVPGLGGGALGSGLGIDPLGPGGARAGSGLEEGPGLGLLPLSTAPGSSSPSALLPPTGLGLPGGIPGGGAGGAGVAGSPGYPMMPGGGRGGSQNPSRSVPLPLSDQDWLATPDGVGSPVDGLGPGRLGSVPGLGGGGSGFPDLGGAEAGSGLDSAPPLDLIIPPTGSSALGVTGPMVNAADIVPPGVRPTAGPITAGGSQAGGFPYMPGGGGGSRGEERRSSVPLPTSADDWTAEADGAVGINGLEPGTSRLPFDPFTVGRHDAGGGAGIGSGLAGGPPGPVVAPPHTGGPGPGPGLHLPPDQPTVPGGAGGNLPGGIRGHGTSTPGWGGSGHPLGVDRRGEETATRSVELPLSDDDWHTGGFDSSGPDGVPCDLPMTAWPGPEGPPLPAAEATGAGTDPGPDLGSAVFDPGGAPLPGLSVGLGGTVVGSDGGTVPGYLVDSDGILRRSTVDVSVPTGPMTDRNRMYLPSPVATPTLRDRIVPAAEPSVPPESPAAPPWRTGGRFDPDAFDALSVDMPGRSYGSSSVAATNGARLDGDCGDPPSGDPDRADDDGRRNTAEAADTPPNPVPDLSLTADASVWGGTEPVWGAAAGGVIE